MPSCFSGSPKGGGGGDMRSLLPGDSLREDVGRLPSQLEERREEGEMLWIRASTERNSAGLICSREQQDEWLSFSGFVFH